MSEKGEPNEGATAILSALMPSDDDWSNATNLSKCLAIFRSRQRPSPRIQSLLVDLQSGDIHAAHEFLLSCCNLQEKDMHSCLKFVATTAWFLQLLLECKAEQERNNMAISLLQTMTKTLKSMVQDYNKDESMENDDEEEDVFQAPTVVHFWLGALLRLVNPYVSSLPFLLPPLWKSLSDLCSSLTTIPKDLSDDLLRALLVYLEEGTSQAFRTVASSQPSQQQTFQVKVLLFLVARVSLVLPVCLKSQSDQLTSVTTVLFQLRGLTLAAPNQQAYEPLIKKVEQCIVTCWVRPSLDRNELNQLLRLKFTNDHELQTSSFILGKASILHHLLEHMVNQVASPPSEHDTQFMLLLCRELLFSTLPNVYTVSPNKSTLLSQILETMVSAILVCFTRNSHQLHRLLLKWLATHLHPLTRELLLCLIHLYVLNSSPESSPRSVTNQQQGHSLLTLLVELLFDTRTQTIHRQNLAGLATRLLSSDKLAAALNRILATELKKCLKQDKAQRKSQGKKDQMSFSRLHVDDVHTIAQVLRSASLTHFPDKQVQSLCREMSNAKQSNYKLGNRSRNALCLLLAVFCGLDQDRFEEKTGMDRDAFCSRLLQWLTKQTEKSERNLLKPRHAMVTVSCLHVVGSSFKGVGLSTLRALVKFISDYARIATRAMLDEKRAAASIIFSIASLLERVSSAIPVSCPSDILQSIASTFMALFKMKSWPIQARCVTSLVHFASTIPAAHQSVLPSCLPTDMQGLLQCRLQKKVYRFAGSHTESESDRVLRDCRHFLLELIPELENKGSLYVPPKYETIQNGSYILTRPTQDGRTTKIIFPPEQQSLADIKFMCGTGGDYGDIQVGVLQQVRSTTTGCQMYCTELDPPLSEW